MLTFNYSLINFTSSSMKDASMKK